VDQLSNQIATFVPLTVLFLTAYLMSKAYLSTGAATPLIERLAGFTGNRPEQILLGYLFLVACFSMMLPNVIAALAFVPLLPVFIERFTYTDERAHRRIATAYALATIWGANIGGMGAMIGGVSNAILVVYAKANGVPGADRINFLTWFYFGIPISLTLVFVCWVVMRIMLRHDFAKVGVAARPLATDVEPAGAHSLGAAQVPHHAITPAQSKVYWSTLIFLVFWLIHAIAEERSQNLTDPLLRQLPMIGSVLFGLGYGWFLLRGRPEGPILPWRATLDLPWRGIAFVAVSSAISLALIAVLDVGSYAGALARWAHEVQVPNMLILFGVMAMVAIATEFLNNVVVALAFFPIIHNVAATLGFHPMALLTAASLMSTATFVLPTGAPSNAIVIGETRGFQFDMAISCGLVMSVLTAAILTVYGMYVIPFVLGL